MSDQEPLVWLLVGAALGALLVLALRRRPRELASAPVVPVPPAAGRTCA